MFQVTVTAATLLELAGALQATADALSTGGAPDVATPPKPKPAATKDKPAPEKEPPEADALNYENDVRPLVIKLSKDHGREAALEVVGKFETADGSTCTKAQEVEESDWPALVKGVNALQKKLDKAKAAAAADE